MCSELHKITHFLTENQYNAIPRIKKKHLTKTIDVQLKERLLNDLKESIYTADSVDARDAFDAFFNVLDFIYRQLEGTSRRLRYRNGVAQVGGVVIVYLPAFTDSLFRIKDSLSYLISLSPPSLVDEFPLVGIDKGRVNTNAGASGITDAVKKLLQYYLSPVLISLEGEHTFDVIKQAYKEYIFSDVYGDPRTQDRLDDIPESFKQADKNCFLVFHAVQPSLAAFKNASLTIRPSFINEFGQHQTSVQRDIILARYLVNNLDLDNILNMPCGLLPDGRLYICWSYFQDYIKEHAYLFEMFNSVDFIHNNKSYAPEYLSNTISSLNTCFNLTKDTTVFKIVDSAPLVKSNKYAYLVLEKGIENRIHKHNYTRRRSSALYTFFENEDASLLCKLGLIDLFEPKQITFLCVDLKQFYERPSLLFCHSDTKAAFSCQISADKRYNIDTQALVSNRGQLDDFGETDPTPSEVAFIKGRKHNPPRSDVTMEFFFKLSKYDRLHRLYASAVSASLPSYTTDKTLNPCFVRHVNGIPYFSSVPLRSLLNRYTGKDEQTVNTIKAEISVFELIIDIAQIALWYESYLEDCTIDVMPCRTPFFKGIPTDKFHEYARVFYENFLQLADWRHLTLSQRRYLLDAGYSKERLKNLNKYYGHTFLSMVEPDISLDAPHLLPSALSHIKAFKVVTDKENNITANSGFFSISLMRFLKQLVSLKHIVDCEQKNASGLSCLHIEETNIVSDSLLINALQSVPKTYFLVHAWATHIECIYLDYLRDYVQPLTDEHLKQFMRERSSSTYTPFDDLLLFSRWPNEPNGRSSKHCHTVVELLAPRAKTSVGHHVRVLRSKLRSALRLLNVNPNTVESRTVGAKIDITESVRNVLLIGYYNTLKAEDISEDEIKVLQFLYELDPIYLNPAVLPARYTSELFDALKKDFDPYKVKCLLEKSLPYSVPEEKKPKKEIDLSALDTTL